MVYSSKYPVTYFPKDTCVYDILFGNNDNISNDKFVYIDCENPDKSLTYSQLQTQILKAAAGLKREFDLQKGDVVAICSPNHIDYLVIVHGTVCASGIVAAIYQNASTEEIADNLGTIQAKILIAHEYGLDNALAAAEMVGLPQSHVLVFNDIELKGVRCTGKTIFGKEELATPLKYTSEQIMNDPAYLYFTSGTTGRSKAVTITQHAMVYALISKQNPRTSRQINTLVYTEFHHVSSLGLVMHNFVYNGYTTYIMPRYTFRQFCENIQSYSIHVISVQPYVASALVNDNIVGEYDLSSLRLALSCGSYLDNSITLGMKRRFGLSFLDMYGMTEVPCLFQTNKDISTAKGTGFLVSGFDAKLVGKDGNEVALGQIGELLVKGPTVTKGYYRNPEATSNTIDEEGYLHIGDLFMCDENDLFTYVDRCKDLISSYTARIYPSEIENILLNHPKVAECAAIGIYYPELATELPRAYVRLVNGEKYSEQVQIELQEYANSRLPDEKRLRGGVLIVDSFPRTASGKVRRHILKQNALEKAVA